MKNYSQYKTWQEVGGELVPVCEKPEVTKFEDLFFGKDYQDAIRNYEACLIEKPLTVKGDINTIKGRKDLKIDVDFRIEKTSEFYKGNYMNQCTYCKEMFHGTDKLWFVCQKCCDKPVAVLIEDKLTEGNKKYMETFKNDLKEDVPNYRCRETRRSGIKF